MFSPVKNRTEIKYTLNYEFTQFKEPLQVLFASGIESLGIFRKFISINAYGNFFQT